MRAQGGRVGLAPVFDGSALKRRRRLRASPPRIYAADLLLRNGNMIPHGGAKRKWSSSDTGETANPSPSLEGEGRVRVVEHASAKLRRAPASRKKHGADPEDLRLRCLTARQGPSRVCGSRLADDEVIVLGSRWYQRKVRQAVLGGVEAGSNKVRPHSSLKGATPKEYAVMTAGLYSET